MFEIIKCWLCFHIWMFFKEDGHNVKRCIKCGREKDEFDF